MYGCSSTGAAGADRYRRKLISMRTSRKDQVHAVLAKLGIPVTCTDLFGRWGSSWLDALPLPHPYAGKVALLRGLIATCSARGARFAPKLNPEMPDRLLAVITALTSGHPRLGLRGSATVPAAAIR